MRLLQLVVFICSILVLLLYSECFSQQDTIGQKPIRLTLKDGMEFIGTVVHEDSTIILFKTTHNISMTVPRIQVKVLETLSGYFEGEKYMRRDPNDTRLFFSSTGRSLKKGQGYFSAYEIFFPSIAVGITDFIMISGGISLIPGAESQLIYLTPKIRLLHLKNFDLSASLQYMSSFGYSFGMSYANATYGTSRASVTGGLGWGFVDGHFSSSPCIILGGETQLSNSIKLITENWFPPKTDVAILLFGIRFFGENIAGDFGLMTTTKSSGGFPFVPWVGFAYNFGGNN
jgi:hypothetical protein